MQTADSIVVNETAKYLSKIDILADLSLDELNSVSKCVRLRHFPAGKIMYGPDQASQTVFMLCWGTVKLYRMSPDGKMITTQLIEPGEIFGEVALLSQHSQGNYAETLTDCDLCTMSHDDLHRLMLTDIRVTQRIIQQLSRQVNELEYQLTALALKPLTERIVALLLFLQRQLAAEQPCIRITHEELAHLVGANRENVTRSLNELQSEGLIELGRGRMKLINLQQFRSSCRQSVS